MRTCCLDVSGEVLSHLSQVERIRTSLCNPLIGISQFDVPDGLILFQYFFVGATKDLTAREIVSRRGQIVVKIDRRLRD